MAVLLTAFTSLIGGGGAAAGAAAGGAAAGAGSLASVLAVGSTIVGGLASIASGNKQKQALNAQAQGEDTKAVQETINGRQDALMAMRKLNQDLSKITVAGFASGLQGDGSVAAAQNEALRVGEANINMSRDNAAFASASRRAQAKQLRVEGQGAGSGGLWGAVSGGLSMLSRSSARG